MIASRPLRTPPRFRPGRHDSLLPPLWTRPRRSPRMSGPTSRAYGVIPSYGDPYIATAASAKDDVEIDGWSTLLCTDDQDPGSLGGSDRDCAALVDEVLVPGEPAAHVGR